MTRPLYIFLATLIMFSPTFAALTWAQNTDADGDSISDLQEGPLTRDTDMDGTPDYLDPDSDGDGIADAIEAGDSNLLSSPRDFDKDGIPDFQDVDSDNDRLPDAVEDANGNGVVDLGETDPHNSDSDGDSLTDGLEDFNLNGQVDKNETDPLNEDSDGDGVGDAVDICPFDGEDLDGLYDDDGCPEEDADGDTLLDTIELGHACLKPLVADTDGDGLIDGVEDKDKDGTVDDNETNPCNRDTDGDTIIDSADQCPLEPEDFDEYRDRDGCPEDNTWPPFPEEDGGGTLGDGGIIGDGGVPSDWDMTGVIGDGGPIGADGNIVKIIPMGGAGCTLANASHSSMTLLLGLFFLLGFLWVANYKRIKK